MSKIIISAVDLGCDICQVHIRGETEAHYVSAAAYKAAYDLTPVTFVEAVTRIPFLREGGLDFDTLPPPEPTSEGQLFGIYYAAGQGLDTTLCHRFVVAVDAAAAMASYAARYDWMSPDGGYTTAAGVHVQLEVRAALVA